MSLKRRSFIRNIAFTGFGATGISSIGIAKNDNNDLFDDVSSMDDRPDLASLSSNTQFSSSNLQSSLFVNVKEFGAKGDGLSDDRTAIQAAIDSIHQTGGTVFIPQGTYRLSLNPEEQLGIKVYSNMQILGAGRGSTILKWLDDVTTTSQHYLLAAHNGFVENVTIADFEIDGNKKKRGEAVFQIRGEGIEMDGKNINIRNMYIHDVLGEGIDCDESDGYFISNVIIENTGGNGIHCSDARVRNVIISHCITRNCAHGRRSVGNVRYGGLVLRGSNIYVDHHISINDAQIANIEGQGRGEESEIVLSGVVGQSTAEDAEGFRAGMQGRVVLFHCRSNLPNSKKENFRAADFEGSLHLNHCYAETGDGVPYALSMKGTLAMEGCTAKIKRLKNTGPAYRLWVDGRITMRNCEYLSPRKKEKEHEVDQIVAVQIGRNDQTATVEANVTGNYLEGGGTTIYLTENVVKGFVSGNICERGILIKGKQITCVNNVVPDVIDDGTNNIIEPNYHSIH